MNGKRQTIWLVSMLSLMVVLSAYYLFTEDSGASVPKETAGSMQVEGAAKDMVGAELPSVGDKGVVVNEVVTKGDVTDDAGAAANDSSTAVDDSSKATNDSSKSTDDSSTAAVTDDSSAGTDDSSKAESAAAGKASTDTGTKTEKTSAATTDSGKKAADKKTASAEEKTPAKDDAAILDEVASQSVSASSLFTNYLYEREQKNLKEQNDLLALINDMEKKPADNAVAQEQLRNLEEKESKINGIEEQLQQKYGEAIVKEEGGNFYKVVVLSDKLDVKQAVGIVDLVMKELSVTQDKVSVQYVSEQ